MNPADTALDLTERLRRRGQSTPDSHGVPECIEAADRIEKLEAEVDRLREGLQAVIDHGTGASPRRLTAVSSPKVIAEIVLAQVGTP